MLRDYQIILTTPSWGGWRVVIAGTNRREIKTNAGEETSVETSVGHQLTVPLVISS